MTRLKTWQLCYTSNSIPGGNPKRYLVEVRQQGVHIATHTVEAPDASAAIDLVERGYGQPVTLEKVAIEDEDGLAHQVTLIGNWHGYMFEARATDPVLKQPVNSTGLLETENLLTLA